jgi:hypothetical protein
VGLSLRSIISWVLTCPYSIDKAREFGWYGHCDTIASMHQVFENFAAMKMLPPIPATLNGSKTRVNSNGPH